MRTETEPLLLDTHIWIWLNEGVAQLPQEVRRRIDRAGARGGVLVSVMSVWEVSLLHARRRLRLDQELRAWVRQALAPPISVADLTPEIALECHHLPAWSHGDPADRILVATARQERMTRSPAIGRSSTTPPEVTSARSPADRRC
jgi:PIN domain nuclease of toxin-antitoxin system